MSGRGVRLAGGRHGGRVLRVPQGVRPTEGRVREALFNIWQDQLPGAHLLDLFAGTGAVSLEALGRDAASAVCIERSGPVLRDLTAACVALGETEVVRLKLTLPAGLSTDTVRQAAPYDLVFADPPYAFEDYEALLAGIAPLLTPDAQVAIEHGSRGDLPERVEGPQGQVLERVEERKYGDCLLSFYRRIVEG